MSVDEVDALDLMRMASLASSFGPGTKKDLIAASNVVEATIIERDHLRAERRWIPVEERLPKRNVEVFVFSNAERVGVIAWLNSHNEWTSSSLIPNITHWMPLPPLPDRGEQDADRGEQSADRGEQWPFDGID